MKRFIFLVIIFLLFFICFTFSQNNKVSFVLNYLEAGDFRKAEEFINNEKDYDLRTYLYAIYYLYKGEIILAEKYTNKISQKYSTNDFFVNYIININRIINNGYEAFETEHFKVFLKGKDIILKNLILEKLEKIYNTYGKIFNCYFEDKIRVEVYNNQQEFYFATTLPEEIIQKTGVVGICKFNKIMILSPENLPFGYRWIDTLAHEYLHFLLNKKTKYKYPLYLHEGTARYFDTIYRSSVPLCFTAGNLKLLVDAKKNNKLIDFSEMKGSLVYFDNQEQIELAFIELASFIEFLITKFGIEKFLMFIEKYNSYDDERKLYKEIFDIEYNDIVNEWKDTLDTRENYVSLYSGAVLDIKIKTSANENNLIGLELEQYIQLGDKFLSFKNYKSALFQYNKAKELEPYNPVVLNRISKVYLLMQKYNESEQVLKECILANPNFVSTYELLIKCYYEKGDYEKIFEIFPSVVEINPFNYEIRKIVAEAYSDLGKIKEALDEYKIIKILQPQNKEIDNIISSLENYLKIKYGQK